MDCGYCVPLKNMLFKVKKIIKNSTIALRSSCLEGEGGGDVVRMIPDFRASSGNFTT